MADSFTANLNLRKPEVGFAEDTWGGVSGLNGDLDRIDGLFQADGNSAVGPAVGPPGAGLRIGTDKVLNAVEGTVKVTGSRFTIQDAADATKKATFGVASIPTASTVTFTLPPLADTLVGLTQAQQLTNKTTPDPPVADNTQKLVPAHWVNAAINAAVTAALAAYAPFNTGDIMASANVKPGWLQLAGQTIGNVGSGAVYANAAALNLFTLFWGINSNAWTINGGRGANAAADFAALKTVTLPNASGYALIMHGGSINLGNYFDVTGTKEVALVAANIPAHKHTVPATPRVAASGLGGVGGGDLTSLGVSVLTETDNSTGTGLAHSNVQPSMAVVWWIKL